MAAPAKACRLDVTGWSLVLAAWFVALAPLGMRALAADMLEEAINYVFTGKVAPTDGPKLIDRKSCIVVAPDPRNKRYVRYHLDRFKMDELRISKTYAGRQTLYTLEVSGDDVIIEYLALDQTTVLNGYRTAQIALPGNIDQTEKALHLIFADHCKPEQQSAPF